MFWWKVLKIEDSCLMKLVIKNLDIVRIIEFIFFFLDLDSWKKKKLDFF